MKQALQKRGLLLGMAGILLALALAVPAAVEVDPQLWEWALIGDPEHPRRAVVAYTITDKASGELLERGQLLTVELNLARGTTRWENDVLYLDKGMSGSFTLDQTSPYIRPQGFLWLETRGDTVAQSVASGVYKNSAPRVGARLPLRVPLRSELAVDVVVPGMNRDDVETRIFADTGEPLAQGGQSRARSAPSMTMELDAAESEPAVILSWAPNSGELRREIIYFDRPYPPLTPMVTDTVFRDIVPNNGLPGTEWPEAGRPYR